MEVGMGRVAGVVVPSNNRHRHHNWHGGRSGRHDPATDLTHDRPVSIWGSAGHHRRDNNVQLSKKNKKKKRTRTRTRRLDANWHVCLHDDVCHCMDVSTSIHSDKDLTMSRPLSCGGRLFSLPPICTDDCTGRSSVATSLPQSGNSNDAVALYRCPERRCRGTGRTPAGSGGKDYGHGTVVVLCSREPAH